MGKTNKRWIQFDWQKLKIFLNIKRAELNISSPKFADYLWIPQDTIYSCIYNNSMECRTYNIFLKKFKNDKRFIEIFS